MVDITFLKEQHERLFDAKRKEHKRLALDIYKNYIEENREKTVDGLYFAEWELSFSEKMPVEIYEGELIVGTGWHRCWNVDASVERYPANLGHFIPDYESLVKLGVDGLIKKINEIKETSDKIALNKKAFLTAITAFSNYIKSYEVKARNLAQSADLENSKRLKRISDNCNVIRKEPPKTFEQAIQLIWFAQIFLVTEANNSAISFGKLDEILYPYYVKDLQNNIATKEEILAVIKRFYIKTSECAESAMLTVGGSNENPLTYLFIQAQAQLNMRQPSIAVVISKTSSDTLFENCKRLIERGAGMPAMFNERVVTEGLNEIGIPQERLKSWAIVGCYEAAPHGAFANSVAGACDLYEIFDLFLEKYADNRSSFNEFFDDFKNFFANYYETVVVERFKTTLSWIENASCPFGACLITGCLDSGLMPGEHGCDLFMFGINLLGIGLVIDSLFVIKKLVYDDEKITVSQLYKQTLSNFNDKKIYSLIKELKGGYGSNEKESNLIAQELSSFIGKTTAETKIADDVISSPALFRFTADIYEKGKYASVNGRKKGELISYGVMPPSTPHCNDVTSVLLSAANVDFNKFPDGAPLMITLDKRDIEKTGILKALIKTYFDKGGFHIAVNAVDFKTLTDAQKNPADYPNLMVKISGYSARFVSLDKVVQDAVIERASKKV